MNFSLFILLVVCKLKCMYDDIVIIHMIIVNVYVTQNLIWIHNLWSRVLSFEANSSNHYIKYCCSNWLLKLANFFKIKHRLHEWQVATWQITGNFVAGVNKNTYIIFEYHHFKQSNLSLFQPQYSAFKLKPVGSFGYLYVIHQLQFVCLLLQVHHYGDTLTFSFVAWKEQKYELAFHTTVHYIKHKILCLV